MPAAAPGAGQNLLLLIEQRNLPHQLVLIDRPAQQTADPLFVDGGVSASKLEKVSHAGQHDIDSQQAAIQCNFGAAYKTIRLPLTINQSRFLAALD